MSESPKSNRQGLARYLSPVDGWAMGFGCMVGWGAFVMPGTTFLPVAGPLGTVLSLLIGMGIMLIIGSSFSFLMAHHPQTGGIYSYTKAAFGRDHAFLCAWFLCLSYLTIVFLNGTALFLVIRTVLGDGLHLGHHYMVAGNPIYVGEVVVSVVALAGIGLLCILAKPALQRLHTVLALVLAAGSVIMAAFCLPKLLAQKNIWTFGLTGISPAYAVFSLIVLAPWAFVGFEVISFDTAHFRFPMDRAKRLTLTSILAAGFVYIAMVLLSVSVIPDGYASWGAYIGDLSSHTGVASVPTFYAAQAICGRGGLYLVAVSALAAILTGIIGGYRAMLRVLSTMAEDRILSEKFQNTSYSILFIMALSIAISLLGRNTLNWFVDLTSFGAIVAYGYTASSAFKLARAEGNRRIAAASAVGFLVSVILVLVQLVPRLSALNAMGSEAYLLLSLWCLLGFVFYRRTVEKSPLTEYSGMSASGTVLFALLVYCAFMWLAKLVEAQDGMESVRRVLRYNGVLLFIIVFTGLMVMLYIQDLVRRKHEEAEREKIRAVESSLAKSRFLFNMSHDIRTPMNAIIGYTDLALKEDSLPQVKAYLGKIRASGDHLLELINDVLEMSRIENGRVEIEYSPEDLGQIFDELRDLFSEQMKQKQIDFTVHADRVQHRCVWCDRRNLNRILLNVVSNAYKFTPQGGTVSVSVLEGGAGEDGYAPYELRVRDSGIGMSREFVEKMFNAFERERTSTDSGIEGTGLGLAITKSIVDLMGGTIEVLTSPGSGTEMIIRLKLKTASKEEVASAHALKSGSEEEVDFTGKRLLLAEDNAVNLEIACMILEQMGFTVETAVNGQEAVEKVASSEPGHYDAVLMDIQMPVMDGYAATRAIRSLNDPKLSAVPILAMTANAFKEDEEASLQAGMQAHIAKPIDVKVLKKALSQTLAKR